MNGRLSISTPGSGRRSFWLGGLMLVLFTGIGLLATVAVAIDWLQGLETWSWEQVGCTIESSEVVPRPDYGDHLFDVTYSFRWRGVERSGSGYRQGYGGSESEGGARVLSSRYPPGLVTSCWVDPDDPSRSALLRANLWRGLVIFVPLLFVAVGGGSFWYVRSLARETAPDVGAAASFDQDVVETSGFGPFGPGATGTPPSPLSRGIRAFKGTGLLVGFFGIFFLFGAGFLVPFFVWPALRVVDARSWHEVPCEILESGVRTHQGDDSNTYSIEVLYRYEYDGREYLSDRYHFLTGSSSGYEGKARIVEGLEPGSTISCYVDPESPQEAVIERGFGGEFLFGLIPLVFVLAGIGGGGVVIAGARAARRSAAEPSWIDPPVREAPPGESGPVTLEPRLGPLGKLVGTTFLAIVWNGLVSVFVWHLIEGWRTGERDWFVAIILAPFVLIGLLLAAGIPFSILALANPRPRLRLSRDPLRPGESAQVEWSFRGFASRIRELEITLEAVRAGAATRGSSARASTEPVTSIEIAKRLRGQGLDFGAASLEIPRSLPDGSPASAEEISWKLKVHGDIAYWPDVDEEYELKVIQPNGTDSSGF